MKCGMENVLSRGGLAVCVWFAAGMGPRAGASETGDGYAIYEVRATSSVRLRLPVSSTTGRVLFLDAADTWQRARTEQDGGARTIHLEAAEMKAGRTLLLIDPPEGLDLNDREAPVLKDLAVDGTFHAPADLVDLGILGVPPRRIGAAFVDRGCFVSPASITALLDGRKLAPDRVQTVADGRVATCTARLPELNFGPHEVLIRVADSAPFRNTREVRILFTFTDTRDVARAALGARVRVDSSYPDYGPAPLIDGDQDQGTTSGSPSVTWASAETPSEHWIEIQLPEPEEIDSVALYWAYRKPSSKTEVQILEDDKWATLASAERQAAEQTSTVIRFAPVRTDRIRILQPPGRGREDRPDLMWVSEVAVRKRK